LEFRAARALLGIGLNLCHPGKALGAALGYVLAKLHLHFFDPKYLERGKVERLLRRR